MRETKIRDLLSMFASFFKIGAFTIGGGYAMLPLIEREFVDNKKWVTPEEIVDVFAIAQSLPGVIAINTSIFIGYKVGKVRGALIAAAGMILPSFLIILVIAALLVNFKDNPWIEKAFGGVRAGVTALILLTGIKLGRSILKNPPSWIIAALSLLLLLFLNVHAILIIVSSAFAGLVAYGCRKAAQS